MTDRESDSGVYRCPYDGCSETFSTVTGLEEHAINDHFAKYAPRDGLNGGRE